MRLEGFLLGAASGAAAAALWARLGAGAGGRRAEDAGEKVQQEEGRSPEKLEGMSPDVVHRQLRGRIDYELTPAENAACLLTAHIAPRLPSPSGGGGLEAKDAAALAYTLRALQTPAALSSVPAVLADTLSPEGLQDITGLEDLDEDTAEYLRTNFTPKRIEEPAARHDHKSFKALSKGIRFAMRLRKVQAGEAAVPYPATTAELADIAEVLKNVDAWEFDVFELTRATKGRPLQTLGWHLLHQYDLISKFGMNPECLRRWLKYIEEQYTDTSYHNATHAADVTQTVSYFLRTGGAGEYLSDIHVFAILLAALVHDVGHDGFNNTFHKNAMTERAISYNDQSIQENFHMATVFAATWHNDEQNIFAGLTPAQNVEIRRMMINMVLGTDMTKHFHHLQTLKSVLDTCGTDADKLQEHIDTIMINVLHAADISNPAKPQRMAQLWADHCLQEFFKQGDTERELGLTISPQCNRDTTALPQTQIGFIKIIVMPMYEHLGELLPEVKRTCRKQLEDNLAYWLEQNEEAKRARSPTEGRPPPSKLAEPIVSIPHSALPCPKLVTSPTALKLTGASLTSAGAADRSPLLQFKTI